MSLLDLEHMRRNTAYVERLVGSPGLALLTVNLQNDFCHANGAIAERAPKEEVEAAVRNAGFLISAARQANVPVLFARTVHNEWTLRGNWLRARVDPDHQAEPTWCQEGSWGADWFIEPDPSDAVITVQRYSAFSQTDLEMILRSRRLGNLLVLGFSTNVSVESTCRDGFVRDFGIILVSDCCAAANRARHDGTVYNIAKHSGATALASEILTLWP